MIQKLPKVKGFKAVGSGKQEVTIQDLNTLGKKNVTRDDLVTAGIITSANKPVKLIGSTELSKAVTIEVDAVSKGAQKAVEAAGGKVTIKSVHAS